MALSSVLLVGCFGKSAEEYVADAKVALAKKNDAAAVIELKNALQADPSLAEARLLLARALYGSGDIAGAAIELDKAAQAGQPKASLAPLDARLMLGRGESAKLLQTYAQTRLEVPADQADLLGSVAIAHGLQRQFSESIRAVDVALQLTPDDVRLLMIRARALNERDGTEAGLQAVEAALAKHADSGEAWQAKGDLLALGGRADEALTAYRQAAKLTPKSVEVQSLLLGLFLDKQDVKAATAQYDILKQVSPKGLQTYFLGAQLSLLKNDLNAAREQIQAVLKVAPNDGRVLQTAAAIELRRGSVIEASRHLSKAVAANPANGSARLMLAQTELRAGDAAKALSTLQPLLETATPSAVALAVAVDASQMKGDATATDAYLQRMAKISPNDVRVQVAMAMADIRKGRTASGTEALRSLAARGPDTTADMALFDLHLREKAFDAALADLAGVERKQPGKPMTALMRGKLELTRGQAGAARQAFESALKLDPGFAPANFALAGLDLGDKDYASATGRYQKVIAAQPHNVEAQLGLVAVRDRSGANVRELADMLKKLVTDMPSEPGPRLALIEAQVKGHQIDQALSTAQEAVAALPDSQEVLAALGRVLMRKGEMDLALANFNKLITLRPESPQSYMPLAEAYASRNDRANAMRTLNRALAQRPDFLPAQAMLLQLATGSGDLAAGRRIAQTVQRQSPESPAGFVLGGDVNAAGKSWDLAAQDYRTALSKGAGSETAIKLDRALTAGGRKAEALKFRADWQGAHPDDVSFLYHLGDTAMAARDLAQAEAHYQSVLKIAPDSAPALNNLAWLLGQAKKPEALRFAERANELAPKQPAFMDTLAGVHAQLGQFDKALEIQKQAVALAPDVAPLRLSLARIYVAAGQKAAAREELTRLAELGDQLPQQQEVRQLLAGL
ncbi:MAG TPA: XrtA/PEP-CTERM system TPR-repeat protein PrsT [Roseateles sp.]|uniref:XrtA/PEP-CTERM system TPR-repeat protein PrsT n=1 Tax=Roseateles sp. TaxID=1971397 RepID=UPI002ED98789